MFVLYLVTMAALVWWKLPQGEQEGTEVEVVVDPKEREVTAKGPGDPMAILRAALLPVRLLLIPLVASLVSIRNGFTEAMLGAYGYAE
jgi:hypothetical protein